MRKILLLWYREEDNFGDSLLADTSCEKLKKNGFDVEHHEIGDTYKNIVEHANRCDFLLFAGGGIIERYVPEIINKFDRVAEQLNVKYGVIGLSIGDFNYDNYAESFRKWVDNASFFYSRDRYTAKILNAYAGKCIVKYSGDCVFGNQEITHEGKSETERKAIGINIRDMPYEDLTGRLNVKHIREIYRKKDSTLIMDSSDELLRIDASEEIRKRLEEYSTKEKMGKVRQIITEISHCKYIIAMRYHVILVASVLGLPAIPIAYCPKVERLSEELGIREIMIYPEEMGLLHQRVKEIDKNYSKYKITVECNVKKMQEKVERMYDDVLEMIKEETE